MAGFTGRLIGLRGKLGRIGTARGRYVVPLVEHGLAPGRVVEAFQETGARALVARQGDRLFLMSRARIGGLPEELVTPEDLFVTRLNYSAIRLHREPNGMMAEIPARTMTVGMRQPLLQVACSGHPRHIYAKSARLTRCPLDGTDLSDLG